MLTRTGSIFEQDRDPQRPFLGHAQRLSLTSRRPTLAWITSPRPLDRVDVLRRSDTGPAEILCRDRRWSVAIGRGLLKLTQGLLMHDCWALAHDHVLDTQQLFVYHS